MKKKQIIDREKRRTQEDREREKEKLNASRGIEIMTRTAWLYYTYTGKPSHGKRRMSDLNKPT